MHAWQSYVRAKQNSHKRNSGKNANGNERHEKDWMMVAIAKTVLDFNVYDSIGISDMVVVHSIDFAAGDDFDGVNNARDWLGEHGYICGSMQMDSPIGFAPDETTAYISKWRNMLYREQRLLAGVIVPIKDFRDGGARLLFFKQPLPEIK